MQEACAPTPRPHLLAQLDHQARLAGAPGAGDDPDRHPRIRLAPGEQPVQLGPALLVEGHHAIFGPQQVDVGGAQAPDLGRIDHQVASQHAAQRKPDLVRDFSDCLALAQQRAGDRRAQLGDRLRIVQHKLIHPRHDAAPAEPANRIPSGAQHSLATFQQLLGRPLGLQAQIDQLGRRQPELVEQDGRIADRRLEVGATLEFDLG